MKIYWHKTNEQGIIPTKRAEDAGFDIYTIEQEYILMPNEKHLFSTGIAAAPEKGYWLLAFDRGSTGSRGIHTHCGIIDNGYRNEIFICLNNDNNYPVKFTNQTDKIYTDELGIYYDHSGNEICGKILYYPISKAIAQIIPISQPVVESVEADDTIWQEMCNTERGLGKLGSSGK